MKTAAVIIFPGSNCDRDAVHALSTIFSMQVQEHWHDDPIEKNYDLIVIPGGFSYGDYLRAGAMAKVSPAVQSIRACLERGSKVLGICNGFQILTEAGYLPGALTKNEDTRFHCHDVYLRCENDQTPWTRHLPLGQVLRMPIAHAEGRYMIDAEGAKKLKEKKQIALRYCNAEGEIDSQSNPNGSMENIAGVFDESFQVLGLMPHPERCCEALLGNEDGKAFFSFLNS
ncbi:MAG: phosphoribosylformylglycinamidine synthase subunit PurQ [Bdellovibrionales bacterium]|nr:phosphoribosylformylglycinamidine synthase subunit PurQ [Bdellovibrionales bacterium]